VVFRNAVCLGIIDIFTYAYFYIFDRYSLVGRGLSNPITGENVVMNLPSFNIVLIRKKFYRLLDANLNSNSSYLSRRTVAYTVYTY